MRKIWKTEDQILEKIKAVKEYAQQRARLSEALAEEARALAKSAQVHEEEKKFNVAARLREQCGEALKQSAHEAMLYKRTVEKTLPRLGEILSAFRTATFVPIMGDYKGVVVK